MIGQLRLECYGLTEVCFIEPLYHPAQILLPAAAPDHYSTESLLCERLQCTGDDRFLDVLREVNRSFPPLLVQYLIFYAFLADQHHLPRLQRQPVNLPAIEIDPTGNCSAFPIESIPHHCIAPR